MLDINSPLEMALAYAGWGKAVFPLHTAVDGVCDCRRSCLSPAKHPRTLKGFKDASTDLEQVRKWWSMWPQANIGIATGPASGLLVIDIDPRNGGFETVERLTAEGKTFKPTAQVGTQAGGFHLYYNYPPDGAGFNSSLGDGIDVKADGGYVVAPPSVGLEGRYYWQVACPLEDM